MFITFLLFIFINLVFFLNFLFPLITLSFFVSFVYIHSCIILYYNISSALFSPLWFLSFFLLLTYLVLYINYFSVNSLRHPSIADPVINIPGADHAIHKLKNTNKSPYISLLIYYYILYSFFF